MSFTVADKQLQKAMDRVQIQVQRFFQAQDPVLRRMLIFASKSQGKRMRTRLTLLAAQACGNLNPAVEHMAAAWEVFHFATLAHDDVIDHSDQRRHHPTLNFKFGNEIAVMVGDLLLTQVLRLLVRKIPADVQTVVAETAYRVCLGEIQEHQVRGQWDLPQAAYLRINRNKTAALFAACCQSGAMLAKATASQSKKFWEYGQAFGMAFQIQDDILDVVAKTKTLGKAQGTDLKQGRTTLPVILGMKKLPLPARNILRQALGRRRPPVATIRELLQESGMIAEARQIARQYARQAARAMGTIRDSAARQQLLQLAALAVEREY